MSLDPLGGPWCNPLKRGDTIHVVSEGETDSVLFHILVLFCLVLISSRTPR